MIAKKKTYNKVFVYILFVLIALSFSSFVLLKPDYHADATFWTDANNYDTNFEGSGTSDEPYLISTNKQLAGMAYFINHSAYNGAYASKIYKVTNNINLEQHDWVPIGTAANQFKGVFDGNGLVISGIQIRQSASGLGLFGYATGATFRNIKISGLYNPGVSSYVGGLVGSGTNLTIEKVINSVIINTTGNYVGGIAGNLGGTSTVKVSYNNATISGGIYVGGLVGYLNGSINDTFNLKAITGKSTVGGLVGYIYASETEYHNSKNYNLGNISSSYGALGGIAGTIIGRNYPPYGAFLSYSFNKGNVTALVVTGETQNEINGGLVGSIQNVSIVNSYNEGDVTANNTNGYTGGIVASMSTSTLTNVSNSGHIKKGAPGNKDSIIGGIVGRAQGNSTNSSLIGNAFNSGKIEGTNRTGGIVGFSFTYVAVLYSGNTGEVIGGERVGGIYGEGGTVFESYNTGSITGTLNVGGIVGLYNENIVSNYVSQNYNSGTIKGGENRGGIVGYMDHSSYSVRDNYNVGIISTQTTSKYVGAIVGRNYYDRGNVSNNYFLSGTSTPNRALGTSNSNGTNSSNGTSYEKTSSQMTGTSLLSSINPEWKNAFVSGGSGSYPILKDARYQAVTVTLTSLSSAVWGVDSNINNGDPYFKDFYW